MRELRFDSAREAVDLLKGHGFKVLTEIVDPVNFGNAYVDLKRENVRVRIVRDRDEHFVQIGSSAAPERWVSASLVLQLLNVREIEPHQLQASATLNMVRMIVGVIDQIESAFSKSEWPSTSEKLKEFQLRRRKDRLGF
jgi:hypothetical protein